MSAAITTSEGDGVARAWRDPAAWSRTADIVAVLIALSLPWSTSLTSIFVAIWLIAVVPTLEIKIFLRSLRAPICAFPIALFVLAVVGTLWSDATWGARLYAVGPVFKLLMLPVVFYHYERSTHGMWVFNAFLISCALLMVMSWVVFFYPQISLQTLNPAPGIFVKNYIDQSQEFALCAVALAFPIVNLLRTKRTVLAWLLFAIAMSFVVNMGFVVVSRTALVTMPIMLAVFALLHLRWRSIVVIFFGAIMLATLAWVASPQLRWKVSTFVSDYQGYKEEGRATSIGERLEYWQKSLQFIAEAPIMGHGT
jgi:O-antigen ligase